MQEIKIYVAANGALGTIRDYANAKNVAAPTLVRGCEVLLRLRLFADADGDMPYPFDQLQNVISWQWVMDSDYNSETAYILTAENSSIKINSVTERIDDIEERQFTEISIPLLQTNTMQLSQWLGTQKSRNGLNAELVGYDATGADIFVLQLENFVLRNRITSQGEPTEIDPEYMTAAQIQAIVAGLQKQIDAAANIVASDITIANDAQYFAGKSVEEALQLLGEQYEATCEYLENIESELAKI